MNIKIYEIKEKMQKLKKNYGKIETNLMPGIVDDEVEAEACYENEKALAFIVQEPNRKRAFFAFTEEEPCKELLSMLPAGTILESVSRTDTNPFEHIFNDSGMERYALYYRVTSCYFDNPYLIPEKGRRALLMEMYDPTCGEYAKEEDVTELYELTRKNFDPLCDDVFTIEQWKEIVSRNECLYYREDGKIVAFYVWRLEGKKLYSNMAVNEGPANYLYNLERRVFEEMWNKGIRIFYAWFNCKNTKAIRRGNEDTAKVAKPPEIIYNHVFIKK